MNESCQRARELAAESRPAARRPGDATWLAAHLADCRACAAYAAALAAWADETDDELAAVPDAVAAAVWPRLAAALPAAAPRAHPRRRWVPALAAAAAALVVATGWLTVENTRLRAQVAAGRPAPAAVLGSAHGLTTGELAARLRDLAPETPVLSAGEAAALLRRDRPLAFALARGPRLDALLADGVTAAEALQLLDRLGPDVRVGPSAPAGKRS